MKIALVLGRAPAEIKLHLRVYAQNAKRYAHLREVLKQYFQPTEKHKHERAVPMEVGAVHFESDRDLK